MASHLLISTPLCTFTRFQPAKLASPEAVSSRASAAKPLRPVTASTINNTEQIARRSANYLPSIWKDSYLQSLESVYTEDAHKRRAENLIEDVRLKLEEVSAPSYQLKLIDDLERLGVSYHFEDEIKKILKNIFDSRNSNHQRDEQDLFTTGLEFRLLRQHGLRVPQEIFSEFKDETGSFKPCLSTDTKGLLSFYEASYLSVEGESMLEDARDFATKHLMKNLNHNMDELLATEVRHSLEIPLHWRMPRQVTRWFIEVYAKKPDMNPILLELAMLDFNMVQAIHQKDLKESSRWWNNTGMAEKLSFARDRLMECFSWTIGKAFEPQYGYCRIIETKVNCLLTAIDDIYDVYGTLDELVLFNDAIQRWDLNSMDKLPNYMKLCFLALFNFVNEMAYVALKEQDVDILPNLKKLWADMSNVYLKEAKWYYSGYTPTLDEYLDNAWFSSGGPLMISHLYFCHAKPMTKEAFKGIELYPTVIRRASMVLRLCDDLMTTSRELERGDNQKAIQCYMHETGASEEEAREYLVNLIGETWKEMNEDRFGDSPFPESFIRMAINLAKASHCVYQYGDGHGSQNYVIKDLLSALLVEPIHL